MKQRQLDFSGGINAYESNHLIGPNEYPLGFNLRVRDNIVSGVKAPVKDLTAPSGTKQGLYGFNQYLFLINSGQIFYKDTTIPSTWTLIPTVIMDSAVPRVYVQPIPATARMFGRKLESSDTINGTSLDTKVKFDSALVLNGVAAGLVFSDGVSQSKYLYIDDSLGPIARTTQDYYAWTFNGTREYVPIGAQMAFINGKLMMVAPDGVTLYHSVTLRPLDFVVNVTDTGEKGGNATTTEYAASPLNITGLFPLPTGQLLASTLDGCYPIDFDYTKTQFAEPTFKNNRRFNAGVINQFSAVDILEDYVFIDQDGIRSYFGSVSDDNEGRNSVFSRKLGDLVEGIQQDPDKCCAYVFDNYAHFAVRTKFGYNVLIYDTIKKVWASVDTYGIAPIKQFAAVKSQFNPTLYAITENDVYEMYSGEYLTSTLYTRAVSPEDAAMEVRLSDAYLVFDESPSADEISVVEYINSVRGAVVLQNLATSFAGITYPVTYPVSFLANNSLQHIRVNFGKQSTYGFKSSAIITWSNGAKLIQWQPEFEISGNRTPIRQRAESYAS